MLDASYSAEVGTVGERVVKDELEKCGGLVRRHTTKDAQFLYGDMEYENIHYEVKAEEKYTGNLFIEILSDIQTNRPGWAHSSRNHLLKCDVLVYFFLDKKLSYWIDWQMFYHKFLALRTLAEGKTPLIKSYHEVSQYKTIQNIIPSGRLLPIDDLGDTLIDVVHH